MWILVFTAVIWGHHIKVIETGPYDQPTCYELRDEMKEFIQDHHMDFQVSCHVQV